MTEMPDQKLDAIAAKVDRIYTEVVGDIAFGNPGIVGRLKDHDIKFEEVEDMIKRNEDQIKEMRDNAYKDKLKFGAAGTVIGGITGAAAGGAKSLIAKVAAAFTFLKLP